MNELFNLFIIGLVINLILFIIDLVNKNYQRIYNYLIFGSLAAILDLIVEFAGTYNLFWTYNVSFYFIFDLIPIELPAIFFTSAVIGKFLHSKFKDVNWKLNVNFIFLFISAVGFTIYILSNMIFDLDDSLIVFTLPIGVWGVYTFKNDNDALEIGINNLKTYETTDKVFSWQLNHDFVKKYKESYLKRMKKNRYLNLRLI